MSPSTLAPAEWPPPTVSKYTCSHTRARRQLCQAQLLLFPPSLVLFQTGFFPLGAVKFRAIFIYHPSCTGSALSQKQKCFRRGTLLSVPRIYLLNKEQNHIHLCHLKRLEGHSPSHFYLYKGMSLSKMAPWTALSLRTGNSPGIKDSPSEVTEILEYGHGILQFQDLLFLVFEKCQGKTENNLWESQGNSN